MEFDLAIVGAGGAGLAVLRALDRSARSEARVAPGPAGPRRERLRIVVVDPSTAAPQRTWCFVDDGHEALAGLDTLATGSWSALTTISAGGVARRQDLGGLRYVMLTGKAVAADASAAAERLGAVRLYRSVESLHDEADGVRIVLDDGDVWARWVLDSRPEAGPGAGQWCQHFAGRMLRARTETFDPGACTLMDFSVPQPRELLESGPGAEQGFAFGYVLPWSTREALVEYTVFSPHPWSPEAYERGLDALITQRWGSGLEAARVLETERGVIPLNPAPHPRRASTHVWRIGTSGGATRASSGYTFAAMHRQAHEMAARLNGGRSPIPPRAYPARHRWFDAVLLRALITGGVDPRELFTGLFQAHPAALVLKFMEGRTSVAQEVALMKTMPRGPMLRAALGVGPPDSQRGRRDPVA